MTQPPGLRKSRAQGRLNPEESREETVPMAEPSTPNPPDPDNEDVVERWNELSEQSQRVVEAFIERQETGDTYSIVDMAGIGRAFAQLTAKMLEDPAKLAQIGRAHV